MFAYYLDLALRSLKRNKMLTALMIVAIAVGIGASMTTLTVMHLLSGDPLVLAFGGGAFMDAQTRAATRDEAVSIWLRCPLPTLLRRVASRDNRPLLAGGDPAEVLQRLIEARYPVYAEADVVVDCVDESPEATTSRVLNALLAWRPPRRLSVVLPSTSYEVVIGDGLLSIVAHTTWFTPKDLRSTTGLPGTRQVPLAEALTADIVCIHEPLVIPAGALRRGTHVNALAAITLPEDLVAQRYDEAKDLPALAAGLIDGRVLDELTIFSAVR